MKIKRNLLWILFFAFVGLAIAFKGNEPLFISKGPYALGKYVAWLLFFCFLGYTLYCSAKENFFSSMRRLYPLLWARQITIDLYIGLVLSCMLIYLNEGSLLVLALWLIPMLLFANLATLLYVAMNYDSLISHFVL